MKNFVNRIVRFTDRRKNADNRRNLGRLGLLSAAAALLCLSFTACSDDEPNPGENGGFESKKVTAIYDIYSENGSMQEDSSPDWTFTYDSSGRLIKWGRDDSRYYQITYKKSELLIEEYYEDEKEDYYFTATLGDNGCIQKLYGYEKGVAYGEWDFTYDSSNHLTRVVMGDYEEDDSSAYIYNLSWEGDLLVKVTEGNENWQGTTTYTYGNLESKGLVLYETIYYMDFDDLEYLAFGGLLGKAPKYLPTSSTDSYGDKTECSWTENSDGYPATFIKSYDWGGGYGNRFVWK